jgi:hypothetical protein
MRNGQNNKRMRGRNRSKGGHHQNPLSRVYESNGQDVKIRGTASHIAEKYLQLARDAQSSGDPVAAENYYQHAEHYFRLIAAAQEQLRQTQPYFQQQPGGNQQDDGDDGDDDEQPRIEGEPFAPREPQSFYPREQQHQQPQQYQPQQHHQQHNQHHQNHQPQHNQPQPQHQPQQYQPRPQHTPPQHEPDVERLPSFITGGQSQPQPQQNGQGGNGPSGNGQNGYDGSPDRFPLHRRRRRHRSGPRDHTPDHMASGNNDGGGQPSEPQSDE